MREILGRRCGMVSRKASRRNRDRRYSNVAAMQRALKYRMVPLYSVLAAVLLTALYFYIYNMKSSMSDMESQIAAVAQELNGLRQEKNAGIARDAFRDSVYNDIALRLEAVFSGYENIALGGDEFIELSLRTENIRQGYSNATDDFMLISAFDAYFYRLQQDYLSRLADQ